MAVAAAATAMPAAAVAGRTSAGGAGAGRGEGGKFLGQFPGAAMRAFRALPVTGADEDFAVALALFAMKLVNRHEGKITGWAKISSGKRARESTHCRSRGDETHSKKLETPYVVSYNFTATIFRGAAGGHGSSGPRRHRWY